jgi:hypothetical protein
MNSTPSGANGGHARLRDAPHTHGPGTACPRRRHRLWGGLERTACPLTLSNQPWAEPLSLHPMTPAYVVCHELSAWDGRLPGALLQRVTSVGAQVFVGGLERILKALADRYRLRQGSLACQELAVMFGRTRCRPRWKRCIRRRNGWSPGLAGRTRAGPVHAGCGRERARRRVMSRIIDWPSCRPSASFPSSADCADPARGCVSRHALTYWTSSPPCCSSVAWC